MIRGVFVGAMALLLGVTSTATATSAKAQNKADSMNIKMTIASQIITATLEDSHSARDFFCHAPLTLPLEDYADTEKIAYLPRKLTTQGAPKALTRTWGSHLLRPVGQSGDLLSGLWLFDRTD